MAPARTCRWLLVMLLVKPSCGQGHSQGPGPYPSQGQGQGHGQVTPSTVVQCSMDACRLRDELSQMIKAEIRAMKTDVNECGSNPCQNGGNCTDDIGRYQCSCKHGYTGNNCHIDVNECASNPCQNNGTCVDGVSRYQCICPRRFTGDTCDRVTTLSCPNSQWKLYRGMCYYFFTGTATWPAASDTCLAMGGHLASIHSEYEQMYILRNSQPASWIGLSLTNPGTMDWQRRLLLGSANPYTWTDGTPLNYVKWDRGQPNNRNGAEFCIYQEKPNGPWHDDRCSAAHSFSCKASGMQSSSNAVNTIFVQANEEDMRSRRKQLKVIIELQGQSEVAGAIDVEADGCYNNPWWSRIRPRTNRSLPCTPRANGVLHQ